MPLDASLIKKVTLSTANEDLSSLSSRVKRIEETVSSIRRQLHGVWPTAMSADSKNAEPEHIVDSIHIKVSGINATCADIEDHLSVICDALGDSFSQRAE